MNSIQKSMMKAFVAMHVRVYRWSKGKIGSSMQGGSLLLLTTVGRKTGQARTVPVMYIKDAAGNPVVCASFAGEPVDPAWFNNLSSNPDVTFEIPGKQVKAHARVTTGDERNRLWSQLTIAHPNFLDYEKKTTRLIPMVVLEPKNT